MRHAIYLIARAAALAAYCAGAAATDGDLDPAFGSGGVARSGAGNIGPIMTSRPVVQADGKVLVCGYIATGGAGGNDFYVTRFTPDGQPDTDFNLGGHASVDFGGDDQCTGMAVQSDGGIVLAGITTPSGGYGNFAVARLHSDGSPDTSFGAGTGKATIAFDIGGNGTDGANAVTLQADGKIVAAGFAQISVSGYAFAIARLNSDGSRDATFNLTGKTTISFNLAPTQDFCQDVAIDSQGRIVAAGIAYASAYNADFAVVRLLPNGTLDAGFNTSGHKTVAFDLGGPNGSNADFAYAVTLTRDGKIVLAGGADISTTDFTNTTPRNFDMALARLDSDGSDDGTFGIGGKVVVTFDQASASNDAAHGVAEQSNGKLVVAGNTGTGQTINTAVARFNADGTLDEQFGTLGKQTLDFGLYAPDSQPAYGVAFQGTQILVSGLVGVGASGATDLFVARLQNDLIFAGSFE